MYPITIRVTDDGTPNLFDEETFNVTVSEVNVAPVLAVIGDRAVNEQVLLSLVASATDVDLPANALTFTLQGAPPPGASINALTGVFSWTPTEAQGPGVYPATIRVTDNGSSNLFDEETFNITVSEVNVAPVLAVIGDRAVNEQVLLSFGAGATDADLPANTLTWSLQGSPPAGAAIVPGTGAFTWAPTEAQGPGVYPVTIRVTDNGTPNLFDEETFNITVAEINVAPVLAAIGDQAVNEQVLLSFSAGATDADLPANALTFSLQGVSPAGAAINPGTGAFTWTPTEAQGPGVYPVTIRVMDNGTPNLFDEETFNVTVSEINIAPVLAAIGDQAVNELALLSFSAGATDADLPANTLTFSLQGVPPVGAAINPGTGAFTWTPTEAQGPGVYPVTIRVTDNGTPNLFDEETFNVTVSEINVAPVLDPVGDRIVNETTLLTFTATATDADLPANTLGFSLQGVPPAGASITAGGLFTWTPTEAQGPGVYPVTIRVTDNGTPNLFDEETINVTVNEANIAPVLGAIGDRAVDELVLLGFIATATDADTPPNALSFSLQGAPPAGAAINPLTGAFTWTPTEAQGPGVYPITVRVTDNGVPNLWDEETFNVTVSEVNVAPVLAAIGDQSIDEGLLLTFAASAPDADLPANVLTFSLQGSPPAGAVINPVTGGFTWTPTEAQGPGVYPVTVRVTDDGIPNLFDEETFNVTVNEANNPPVLAAIGDRAVDELVLLAFVAGATDSDIPANGLTFSLQGAPPAGVAINPLTGAFTWTPTEAHGPGVYPVTVRVTDDGAPNLFDEETFNITINEINVAPVLAAIGDRSTDELVALSFVASATDVDLPANTLTFSLQGAPPAGASINPLTGLFDWTPTEAQGPGVYPITVRVTDNGTPNLFDEETFNLTVNEINVAPVLAAIGDQAINEGLPLAFAASGTDVDLPANTLTYTLEGSPPAGATINAVSGGFTWTPSEAQGPGVYAVTVRVTDDGAPVLFDEETFNVTVSEVNVAPVLAAIGDRSTDELVPLVFVASAGDVDLPANTLTFSLQGAPPVGASINPVTGAFSWTPTEAQGPGVYPITVRVTDDGAPNLFDEETINVTVAEVNVAPVLALIGDQSTNEMVLFAFTAMAIDTDLPANTLTYSFEGSPPAGAAINPVTGDFTWTPTEAQGPGVYSVTVRVTDDGSPNMFDEEAFNVTVNEVNVAPVLAGIGDQSTDELVLLPFLASATDADLPTNGVTFSLQGVPPAGAVINPVTGAFSWTPTEVQGPGVYPVTVRVTDDGTPILFDEETFNITVNEVNVAPVLAAIGDRSVDELALLTFTASATDVDLPANGLTFTLQGAPPAGAAINPVTGDFTWTPTETQGPGAYPITIRVTDDSTPSLFDEETFNVTVNEVNVAPVLGAIGDRSVDELLLLALTATVTDVDLPANDHIFSLKGAPPAGAAIGPVTGDFTWTPTEAQGPGIYPITIRVTDDGTPSLFDEETFIVTVNEVNVAPVLDPIGDQSVDEETLLSLTATATDVDVPANGLTFTVVAGPAGVLIDPLTGAFTWTPTEAQGPAGYAVTVRVTDDGVPNLFNEETLTITVDEANVAPVLDPIADQVVDEETLLSLTATAADVDLPGNVISFTLAGAPPAGAAIDPVTGAFTWTPNEAQGPGTYPIAVRVTDDGTPSLIAEQTVTITVNEVNIAPVLADPGDQAGDENDAVTLAMVATDIDLPANTLTFFATDLPDGLGIDAATGEVTGTLTYDAAGTYPVTVTVTDDGAPILSATVGFDWVVADVNREPVGAADGYTVDVGATRNVAVPGVLDNDTDPNGDPLTAVLLTGPSRGALALNSNGSFTYTHTSSDKTADSFTYVAFDGTLSSETVTVTILIAGNQNPIAVDDAITIDEDTSGAIDVLANDSDPDGDILLAEIVSGPDAGSIAQSGAGVWTYTSLPDWSGVDSFTYRISDGNGGVATAIVTVDVTPTNDPPEAPDLFGDIDAGDPIDFDLLALATDPDDDPLSLAFGNPSHGELTRSGGVVTYTSQLGFHGSDSFTYTVADGRGGVVTRLVTVNVSGVTATTLGLPALVEFVDTGAVNTVEEFGDVEIPGLDLVFGSVFQAFAMLQMPLLALVLAFGLSLMLGLSRGLVFGAGAVYLSPIRPGRSAVVFIGPDEKLPVREDVGDRHEIIYEFDPAKRDLRTTGRRAQLGSQLWVEVETPDGDGWVSDQPHDSVPGERDQQRSCSCRSCEQAGDHHRGPWQHRACDRHSGASCRALRTTRAHRR